MVTKSSSFKFLLVLGFLVALAHSVFGLGMFADIYGNNHNITGVNLVEASYFSGDCSNCTGIGPYLENVVEDTTPQLGGDLDAQSYNITVNVLDEVQDIHLTDYLNIYAHPFSGYYHWRMANIDGSSNSFYGIDTGVNCTGMSNCQSNLAMGSYAGLNLGVGATGFFGPAAKSNVMIGSRAGQYGKVLNYNMLLGAISGQNLDGGSSFNTMVGYSSGTDVSYASSDTYIGAYSGDSSDGSRNTFIGAYSGAGSKDTANLDNGIILGYQVASGFFSHNYSGMDNLFLVGYEDTNLLVGNTHDSSITIGNVSSVKNSTLHVEGDLNVTSDSALDGLIICTFTNATSSGTILTRNYTRAVNAGCDI